MSVEKLFSQVILLTAHITIVQGIRESRLIQEERTKGRNVNNNLASSSRRRKGPAFLPSEHDDLPNGVAFMVRLVLCLHRRRG